MEHWDTIVIGSGSGGLTAAVALARQGRKVLVLEQHYLPGGWMHSFTLEGYRFSPGVHYIGDLGPAGGVRRLYEGLGVGADLEFCELEPDGFDHLLIGDQRFDVPKGFERYKARLLARFPHERAGLERYFDTLWRIVRQLRACERSLSFPDVLTVPFRAPTLLRYGFRTLDVLLDDCIRNPLLKAILSATSGDHGLAPSRVSLPMHASVVAHYYEGAWYPRGGAKAIPQAMLQALRRRGGKIRLRTKVSRIRTRGGRAIGVELESGEKIAASSVICNADPAVLYRDLLSAEDAGRERARVARMEYSVSLVSLFLGVELDLRGMGFDSGNYWWYRSPDVNGIYERIERSLPGRDLEGLFLTITTLKDPGHVAKPGHHTLEMFTFVPYEPFAPYADMPSERRPPAYHRLKESIADRMIDAASTFVPGLRDAIRFRAVGSPLTNDYYCATHRGAAYGTAKTPMQLGPFSFSAKTPIEGLYTCGQSTVSHGVAGAATSGLIAAQQILGFARPEDALGPADGSLRTYPADRPELWLAEAEARKKKSVGARERRVLAT